MQIEPILPAGRPNDTPKGLADQLEQAFLEEMLKYYGPPPAEGAFSGGAGEYHFASFLAREHATILAGQLDLGFARMLGESA